MSGAAVDLYADLFRELGPGNAVLSARARACADLGHIPIELGAIGAEGEEHIETRCQRCLARLESPGDP